MMWIKKIAALGLSALMAACGGGGGSAGTSPFGNGTDTGGTGGTPGTPSVLVSISTTSVSAAAPATVTATVLSSTGSALPGQVVSFSTSGGLGAFSVNSALTNASGVATVQLSPASPTSNGADLAVATASVAGASTSGTIGFSVAATSPPVVGTPSMSIALSSTVVTAAAPATVIATVKDAAGSPVSGQVVKFSSVDPLGTFNPPSALSDANGQVAVKLSPATATTNGAALAVAQATVSGSQVTATAGFTASSSGAPAAGTPSIALTLSNSIVTTSAPVIATAVVKDGTGAAVAGQVVKFNTVDGFGTFSVSSSLTDVTGAASVTLSAVSGSSGADQVVASTTVNGTALQAAQGFQLTVANAAIASFSSDFANLVPYGQANLTVMVTGASVATPVNLALSSACVAAGKATLTPSMATTTTGTATFTYRDAGCGASNITDSLQASIVNTSVVKSLSIGLTAPTVSSITFSSATPSTIYLKSSGLTETSNLIFRVVDTAGNGLPNQSVTLSLLTASGGLTLDGGSGPVTKLSDSLGNVSVLINSGTVPTPVSVKATLADGISTVSSGLSIGVGLPSELNFSLSQGTKNIEGYDIDGTPNTYSIIASDRLSNPVPTGTAINFIAEGGQVEPSKTTTLVNGLARTSANYVSAGTRPLDGRVTVLAYALGEESFLDSNGNNVWDTGTDTQFQDLGAVFLSRKYLNTYFQPTDQLIPLAIPGVTSTSACSAITTPLLQLDVTTPSVGGSTCDAFWGKAYVRRAVETVLSTSSARLLWPATRPALHANSGQSCPLVQDVTSTPATPQNLLIGYDDATGAETRLQGVQYQVRGGTTVYNAPATFTFIVADANPVRLNPVAAGTTITATATQGLTVEISGGSPVPSTLAATAVSMTLKFESASSGTVTLHVRSPSGLTTDIGLNVDSGAIVASGSTLCP